MEILLDFDSNELPKKYSKYAEESDWYKNQPVTSFPFKISNVPNRTRYFAITLIDYDAIPVCGFTWIHWTVANIASHLTDIPENFSRKDGFSKIHGTNSFTSALANEADIEITQRYVGPTPPDKDHQYKLTVYALDEALDLNEGFYLNEFYNSLKNKIISEVSVDIIGKK